MQSIAAGLQTEFAKTKSDPERVFNYQGVAKSTYVKTWASISRSADSVTSGNVTLEISNTDQSWNAILSSPGSHLIPGATASTLQIGYTGIGFMTLFTGRLEEAPAFSNVDAVSLSFRDKIAFFMESQIGSSQVPADYFSSSGILVTDFAGGTTRDWSAGRNPADLIWSLLTLYGGLDSTESTANTDIDWTKFAEYRTLLNSVGIKIQALYQGETLGNALKEISDYCLSAIFSESDGKIVCRYWLGQDNTSVQSYDNTKWNYLPVPSISRYSVLNRYVIYYGLTFTNSDTGTATSGTSTTLTNTAKTWTVNAYQNFYVNITAGTGVGQTRVITSNTTNTLTVSFVFSTAPDGTSTYKIYDASEGNFASSTVEESAASKTLYGTLEQVFDSRNLWFYDSSSATNLGQRKLIDTQNPIPSAEFECGLSAYRQQLWDALKLTESFYSWTDQGFRIEQITFNLENGTVLFGGRVTSLYPFLILDDPVFGIIDSTNVLA